MTTAESTFNLPRPPPFLLGAGLLFWGWQTGFPIAGLVMAVVLEGARWVQARWEFSDQDFNRIWVFCTLTLIGSVVYAFSNEGLADFRGLLQNPTLLNQRNAGLASARTVASVLRWLPMVFLLFIAAQTYSTRQGVPMETVSLIMRLRWRKARRLGRPRPPSQSVDVSYPYFGLCLFGASLHTGEGPGFFWGLTALLGWALWSLRPRRFGLAVWGAVFAVSVLTGFWGQLGLAQLQRYLENYNPQWLADFTRHRLDPSRSRTDLGAVARRKMSGNIVLRLELLSGAIPDRLREASYRTFKGLSWYAEAREQDFENVPSETNGTTWVLLPGKPTGNTVQIASYLAGGTALLPLPTGSARLERLPAYLLQKSGLGAVLAQGPGLVVFEAHHGPGPTIDGAPAGADDLSVPEREVPALDATIEKLGLRGLPLQTQLRRINNYFLENFTYSMAGDPDLRFASGAETLLSRFLLKTRRGHCEYFASATVLLLRRLDIPARYAVGYAVHEGSGKKYIVRRRDAHAWCLVWDQARNHWSDFDTTPPSWLETEDMRLSWFQGVKDAWSRVWYEFSRLRWGQSNLRQYVFWVLGPVLLVLLAQIMFRRRRRARAARGDATDRAVGWPGLDSELYELERFLARNAGPRGPGETMAEWLKRAGKSLAPAEPGQAWEALVRLHYRYRFDPNGLTAPERQELREEVRRTIAALRAAPA